MESASTKPEQGQKRKFLAIIDQTPEWRRAVAYAARRVKKSNGRLTLLYIIDNYDFQHFLGVHEIMQAEAYKSAEQCLAKIANELYQTYAIKAECVIRQGEKIQTIRDFINEDGEVAILVLAASNVSEKPGPLIQAIAGRSDSIAVPVIIIPHNLTDEDMDAIT